MNEISFVKMAGAGNDFIVVDETAGVSYPRLSRRVCHRTDGIGADGLLVLGPSRKADYRMRIYNADGSQAEMCGNGARCMVRYISQFKKEKRPSIHLQTMAGVIRGSIKGPRVTVTLSRPRDFRESIGINISGRPIELSYMDTGVPHAVIFVDALDRIDVNGIAPQIRRHPVFRPRGANVNFVEELKEGLVRVRTFERGVESETRACGTGAVAAALVTYLKTHPDRKDTKNAATRVVTASGETLRVSFRIKNKTVDEVRLTGQARLIARGKYFIKSI